MTVAEKHTFRRTDYFRPAKKKVASFSTREIGNARECEDTVSTVERKRREAPGVELHARALIFEFSSGLRSQRDPDPCSVRSRPNGSMKRKSTVCLYVYV